MKGGETFSQADFSQKLRVPEGIEFIRADMRDFRRPDSFDLVINLFTSFGYFEDPLDDQKVAANVCDSLTPGGIFLMETMGKEVAIRNFSEKGWHMEGDCYHLEDRRIVGAWERIENTWVEIKPNGEIQETGFSLRLYAASDLKPLLRNAGFKSVEFYGSLTGTPYDHKAVRLIAVARK